MAISSTKIDNRFDADFLLSRPLFFFDLAPVLDRAGSTMLRNPNRLEIVCDHCVRAVTDTDQMVFAGCGFYLVVTSCETPQAEALARKISIVLLRCFFGMGEPPADLLAALFRKPTADEFAALAGPGAPLPREDAAPEAGTPAAEPPRPAIAAATDPLVELAVRGVHRPAAFRFGFVPVHDLRRGTVSTFFCGTVRLHDGEIVYQRDGFASIGPRDMPRVDQAMLLQTLAFGEKLRLAGIVAAVGTSVSFETLGWSKGRQFYQNALRSTASADNNYLIVKIDAIPPGTPAMRIAEMVAAIRPFAKRVFVHLPYDAIGTIQDTNLGAGGFVTSAGPGSTHEEIAALSQRFAKLCNLNGALSCVDQIPNAAAASLVQAAGVRFAEGRIFGSRVVYGNTSPDSIRDYQRELRAMREGTFWEEWDDEVDVSPQSAGDSPHPAPSR